MTKKTSTHLQTRRQAIAAGALDVLAEQGTHKLTHRSVDRHLGLPQGSTSYYFNSREALLMAAADALAQADTQDVLALGDASDLSPLLALWTAPPARTRLLARLELFLEAARNPAFQAHMAQHRALFRHLGEAVMARRGEPNPQAAADEAIAHFEGQLLRVTVFGSDG